MLEETDRKMSDTSERDGWYEPIRTNLEDDVNKSTLTANSHGVRILNILHGDLAET